MGITFSSTTQTQSTPKEPQEKKKLNKNQQEYEKLKNLNYINYEDEDNIDVTHYMKKCILKYINKNQQMKNRMCMYNPLFTFIEEDDFDVLVTQNNHVDNSDNRTYTKEFFSKSTSEIFMTKYMSSDSQVEIMPGIYNSSISYSEYALDISDNSIVFSGENYFNGQTFIEDLCDDNGLITSHKIYKPNGQLYNTYSSYDLKDAVEAFIDQHYDEIIEETQ